MFKFGSTGIVAGYIKQMLATFQLPKMLIYTPAHAEYFEKYGKESPYLLETFPEGIYTTSTEESILPEKFQVNKISHVPYIKDGRIQFYTCGYYTGKELPAQDGKEENSTAEYFKFIPGKWQSAPLDLSLAPGGHWQLYERGEFIPNLTRTFQIKNNVYDSYTHEYLGDYLRFLRDYDNINLMPLYNCFSNSRLSLTRPFNTIKTVKTDFGSFDIKISLDTSDQNFKIYSLPVKLFQNYTIAIDSAYPVELCCGFCNKTLMSATSDELIKTTYRKINTSQFSQPFLYTALTELVAENVSTLDISDTLADHKKKREFLATIAQELSNLRLFIKVSKHTDSSIVVLEGDYRAWNDYTINSSVKDDLCKCGLNKKINRTILTNESIFTDTSIPLISPLQLLNMNTGVQMPFSDRLLEYLLDQCVTGGDSEVRENVLMAQHLAGLRHQGRTQPIKFPIMPNIEKDDTHWIINGRTTNIKHNNASEPVVKIDLSTHCWSINGNITEERVTFDTAKTIRPAGLNYDLTNGVWSEALRRIFYQYMSTRPDFSQTPDTLGYVDKDVEKLFSAVISDKSGKQIKKTMLSFDAWEDIRDE